MNTLMPQMLRELREANGLTQSSVAERVGVTKAAISSYELGARTPSYDTLIKLARLFRVSTDNLLGFNKKASIDVSKLSLPQRNTVQEIVTLYERVNEKER